jgi:hypothetical protein
MNITFSASGNGYKSNNTNAVIWVDPLGNITMATINGQNLTGAYAIFTSFLLEPFADLFTYQNLFLKSATVFAYFHSMGTSSENVGGITMPVTTYQASNIRTGNTTVQRAMVKVGTIPGTNLQMTAEISASGYTTTGISGIETVNYQVLSLARA